MKLEHYGIRGPALHWLENFLSDRTQQVTLDGCRSDTLPVTSGVPQGTVLAPLLFVLYKLSARVGIQLLPTIC